jgi:cyclopropane-fatty-acyl-phospholipid synthase
VLEIGCGWGALAEMATRFDASLVGVTLSTTGLGQRAHGQTEGVAHKTDLRLQSYRDPRPFAEHRRF